MVLSGFLDLNIFVLFFIIISERQEERLKNNNRDLSMVCFIRVIASLAYFTYFYQNQSLRPNKRIPVFRVTRPYLNLLVKPRIISGFREKTAFRNA